MASVIRFSPASDLHRLQREIDRVFDGYFPGRPAETEEAESAVWTPRVDLAESEDAYLIELDLPGITRDQIEINYHEGILSVRGERKETSAEDNRQYIRCERQQGRFYRSFALPKRVAADKIGASFSDGVLSVRIPKAEESKPRKIEVQ